jgi:hypothetical protein
MPGGTLRNVGIISLYEHMDWHDPYICKRLPVIKTRRDLSPPCAITSGDNNEREKTDQLDAKEGKPNRHESTGLHMGYVNQRLANASDQDDYRQGVHCRAVNTQG